MYRIIWTGMLLCLTGSLMAQDSQARISWFVAPEASAMLLDNHVGRTIGFQAGIGLWQDRLRVGFFFYGRSGPINPHTETLTLTAATAYKGQTSLQLRADHGAFGLMIAPQFSLGKWTLDVPLMVGGMGAGFYLTGDNRYTPDGRRVSEWEDQLLEDADAGGGLLLEGGIRARVPIAKAGGIELGAGIHYSQTLNYFSTLGGTDYYNAPRISLFMMFGN